MEIPELMHVLGGVASRRILVNVTSRAALEEALDAGEIVRVAHGRYSVPEVHQGTRLALAVAGHVCLVSAALSHGWKVKVVPDLPQIAVPKDRRMIAETRKSMDLHWIDLGPDGGGTGHLGVHDARDVWSPLAVRRGPRHRGLGTARRLPAG